MLINLGLGTKEFEEHQSLECSVKYNNSLFSQLDWLSTNLWFFGADSETAAVLLWSS